MTDQICKRNAEKKLPMHENFSVSLPHTDRVSLQHVKNKGFALNSLEKHAGIIRASSATACALTGVGFAKSLLRKENPLTRMGLALSFGGGLSNTLDRVVKKEVTDYIAVRHGEKAVVYNLADFSLFAGMALISAGALLKHCKKDE